jgi:hypothetical protein
MIDKKAAMEEAALQFKAGILYHLRCLQRGAANAPLCDPQYEKCVLFAKHPGYCIPSGMLILFFMLLNHSKINRL